MNTIQERQAEKLAASKKYAAQRFGLNESEIIGYNSGCCYDKIWVTTMDAAKKVSAGVEGETVNGGMFHDMPLGGITPDSDGIFEVMC